MCKYTISNIKDSNLGAQAAWSLEEVNSLRPSFAVGTIPPATAVNIGISNAIDHMIVLHIPWTGPYPAQLLITAAGRKEIYLRHCINGTWETPQKILTNADITNKANANYTDPTHTADAYLQTDKDQSALLGLYNGKNRALLKLYPNNTIGLLININGSWQTLETWTPK